MNIYIVTASFDDGDDSWIDHLGAFRHKGKAERFKMEFEHKMQDIANHEPEEPDYSTEIYSNENDFYRSEEWRIYDRAADDYRNANNLERVNIDTYTINGER
jgi:hypothetical protein